MVRQRTVQTRRKDRGRKRRGRRRPVLTGWTLKQLAEWTHVSTRTIAEYLRLGLMRAPEFRGTATRYTREHLLRLLAIRLLKGTGTAGIQAIARKLEPMGQAEIERWVLSHPLEPAVVAALGVTATPSSTATPVSDDAAAFVDPSVARPADKAPLHVWRCVELMPGLQLSLRADAAPVVRQVASHVYTQLENLILEALRSQTTRAG